jgi:hypothetical protein
MRTLRILRQYRLAIAAVALACLGLYGTRVLKSEPPQVEPLTAEYVRMNLGPSGESIGTVDRTFAIRSDGSEVTFRLQAAPDQRARVKKEIIDPVAGLEIGVDEATESRITKAFRGLGDLQVARTSCRDISEPRSSLQGHEVVRMVNSLKPRGGTNSRGFELVQFRAPALNCLPLRTEVYQIEGDKRTLTSVEETLSVRLGEPAEELFTIPETLTERKPSEVFAEFEKRYKGRLPSDEEIRRWQNTIDKSYEFHRP